MCIRDRLLTTGYKNHQIQKHSNNKLLPTNYEKLIMENKRILKYNNNQSLRTDSQNLTIIYNYYLKNLREELLEETVTSRINQHNEILYITAQIEGIPTRIMIDTGANVSLINDAELERIQKQSKNIIPTLPVNNVILIGATGRQNKTVRKQVSLEIESKGVTINIICLVAIGLPFELLIGCDMLRKYSAIIDLSKEKVSLNSEGVMWTAELIGSDGAPLNRTHHQVRELNFLKNDTQCRKIIYNMTNEDLWNSKLQEIREFRHQGTNNLTAKQVEDLIMIYKKYKHVFSEKPGKVKNYQCRIQFKEPAEYHRKSYPIPYSLKEAVRAEINKMLLNDIIEHSKSPYTSPIAVSYTHLDVYKRQTLFSPLRRHLKSLIHFFFTLFSV